MADKRIHRNVFINFLLLFLGIVITLSAGFVEASPVQLFLGGLGGAILGASLSGFLSLLKTLDLTELITETVLTMKRNIGEDETNLTENYRKKYYHYHATVINGKRKWILAIFDFSLEYSPNSLKTRTAFIIGERKPMDYILYGSIIGRSLMISDSIDIGPRCTHMGVFPFFAESFTDVAHGFLFHDNWDAQPQVSPCLLTQHPVENVSGPGAIDEQTAQKLDERWARSVAAATPFNFGLPDQFDLSALVRPPAVDIQPKHTNHG